MRGGGRELSLRYVCVHLPHRVLESVNLSHLFMGFKSLSEWLLGVTFGAFNLLVVVVEGVHGLLVLSVHPALFTETHAFRKFRK